MGHTVYSISWVVIFLVNLSALVVSFASSWGARDEFSTSPLFISTIIVLCVSALAANIIVTDIAAEYVCIMIGAIVFKRGHVLSKKVHGLPSRGSEEPYVVVYCLKSKTSTDITDVLENLEKSWRNNIGYADSVYLILSGTRDEELYVDESTTITAWNALHAEDGVVCKYLRRNRSILYKYGQYLDLIMLLNGHDGTGGETTVALFKDTLPTDGTGCFDSSTDVDYFRGQIQYDRMVILDKDNVLGNDFFVNANRVYNRYDGDIDIIQPAIVPPDMETRSSDGSDTLYGSITIASHNTGLAMEGYRSLFFPSATFFGKGIIRRTRYNEILLGYNPVTKTTEEESRIPRDLVSHDIIESSVMTCVKDSSLHIIEGFPGTDLECHLRQSRWDRGDLILNKYLFSWSYGLLVNLLSRFSNSKCIPFYRHFSSRVTVHTGTFNSRVIVIRPLIFVAAMLYASLRGNMMFDVVFDLYNVEILLLPFIVKVISSNSFGKVLLLTINDVYIGMIDIYYGAARTIRALGSIARGTSTWVPFCDEGHSPFHAMLNFIRCVALELFVALLIAAWFVIKSIDHMVFGGTYLAVLIWLGFVICHPIYVFVTAHKTCK